MRFYAKKIVYGVDTQIKNLSNYNKLTITCADCETKNCFIDHTLLYNSDKYWQDTHDAVDVDMFNIKLVEQEKELAQQAQQDSDELKKSLAGLKTLKFSN